jgi:hypothetical protein
MSGLWAPTWPDLSMQQCLSGVAHLQNVPVHGASLLADPHCLATGFAAGYVGRMAAHAVELAVAPAAAAATARRGVHQTCLRRGAHFGLLWWFYIPLHRKFQWQSDHDDSFTRMLRTVAMAVAAGGLVRIVTNPVSNVRRVGIKHGMDMASAAALMRNSQVGVASFYINTTPIVPNALYAGAAITLFEALRRFGERRGLPMGRAEGSNVATNAACNAAIFGAATVAASAACYPYSRTTYTGILHRQSALKQGLGATLRKEVPMAVAMMATFSLLQPFVSPHHDRCGFGC